MQIEILIIWLSSYKIALLSLVDCDDESSAGILTYCITLNIPLEITANLFKRGQMMFRVFNNNGYLRN